MSYNSVDNPMKPAIKALWLEALKSGQYKKGKLRLRGKDNTFCCLGVLCNLHAQAHPRTAKKQPYPNVYLEATAFLPHAVMRWAGIRTEGAYFSAPGERLKAEWSLSEINDKTSTFKQVIEAIEKHF